jgi:acetyl-CoA carboxylase biotin carboxyl carrier protein
MANNGPNTDTGKKTGGGKNSAMNVDLALIRELAELLNETGLTEIEVEDEDRKIRVARGAAGFAGLAGAPAAYAPIAVTAPAPASPGSSPAATHADALKSPMVGTAYLAAEPGAANFVKIGDSVKEGDTLVIIEAMKVMNPITADRAGKITAILVENAQPVEFDQPLLVIS